MERGPKANDGPTPEEAARRFLRTTNVSSGDDRADAARAGAHDLRSRREGEREAVFEGRASGSANPDFVVTVSKVSGGWAVTMVKYCIEGKPLPPPENK